MKTNWKDEMTPKERLKAFAAGEPLDRIPCMPLVTDHAYSLAGGPMAQYYHSARLMAQAQINAFETYETDSVGSGPGLFGIAEAIGTKLTFPDDGIPYVCSPAISSYQDLAKLELINPYQSGRLPIILEALKIVQETVKERAAVGCSLGGPITTAAAVRGTDKLLRDLNRNPEMVHRLLQYVTDNALLFIDVLCDMGIKPSIAEPTASGTLISSKHFREFAKPYLKQYSDRIIQRCGSGPFVHICGDTMSILDDMVDAGATVLSLDNQIDLAEAKNKVGHRACLAGNVKPYTLWRGTPQEVLEEVKECLRKAYNNPKGFILSSGCGLSVGTPAKNVIAMMDAARQYGKWPVNPDNLA
ncbi:uroporphyrinogen decarboxylase family protein [Sporomusa malonica]|uniref:Uroporphyrinogen decarboxylase n=1 Tax=Sporomusa malonica TaxID=112901 RepID=A0A1W1Y5Z3_9FIRM|nr:uroporphyrinogen decarboxylase family protein [Sporomusa malonica]SMC31559.1 uroporphyrinogen decarboxylase [Sporomusa malonica]